MELRRLYRDVKTRIAQCTESPEYEARMLLKLATGKGFDDMMFGGGYELTDNEKNKLEELVQRRLSGYPIQYLLGKWSFMGREYLVGEGVLIPRDDTEVLVREAEKMARRIDAREIYDLCSGSGIIAVTLAKELRESRVTAVELSEGAFKYLERNCALNNAENVVTVRGDVFKCFDAVSDGSIDILVSNPPYIAENEKTSLQRELLSEPKEALFGGADGLEFYRAILNGWTAKVRRGGGIAFEIGDTQAGDVTEMMLKSGLCDVCTVKDIQGFDRVVYGTVT